MMVGHSQVTRSGERRLRLFASDCQKRALRRSRLGIHEIHDEPLILADDAGVRFGDEIVDARGVPVIAARDAAAIVQALLNDGPFPVRRHDETMQIDLKSVGDGIVVDPRRQAACAHQASPSKPRRSAIERSSCGVLRENLPRPPQMYMPSSSARVARPRFSAPMTEVVIPDECQSMPITRRAPETKRDRSVATGKPRNRNHG